MAAELSAPSDKESHTASRFSILTLDGGGARGYLSTKILEHVETYLNAVTGQKLPLGARSTSSPAPPPAASSR